MNQFSLSDIEFNFTRYQVYAELRKTEPVYWYEPMKTWLVMRHKDIAKLLVSKVVSTDYLIQDKLENSNVRNDSNIIEIRDTIKQWMIYNEAPIHTRLRKFMNMAFQRTYIDNVMPIIKNIVSNKIAMINFTDPVDFVKTFAHPVPAAILSAMIGFEDIDLDLFLQWSDSIANFMQDFVVSPTPDAEIAAKTAQDLIAMKQALRNSIEARKKHPKADLLSHLVHELSINEAPITEEELALQLIHLIFGGHKIPQFVMSNIMHCLLCREELLNQVISDPKQFLTGTIHEAMRYESPIQFITRHAKEDFSLHNKQIKTGESIYLMLGSANRDEEIFEKPDNFDISRPINKHLSFGSGAHTCIGTALVKDELTAIFHQLFSNMKSVQPFYDLARPEWTNNATFHGILSQPIKINYEDRSISAKSGCLAAVM